MQDVSLESEARLCYNHAFHMCLIEHFMCFYTRTHTHKHMHTRARAQYLSLEIELRLCYNNMFYVYAMPQLVRVHLLQCRASHWKMRYASGITVFVLHVCVCVIEQFTRVYILERRLNH